MSQIESWSAMARLLPDGPEKLKAKNFCVVEFPSKHWHPGSRATARGARYMARAFSGLLQKDGIPCEFAKVPCPHRPSVLVEGMTQRVASLLREDWDKTDALRQFEWFRQEAQSSFDTILALLQRWHTLFLTAWSHDAIWRVLAFKEAFPEWIILDFDKHPDLQIIWSWDAPGGDGKVNGHAIWASVVTWFQHPVFEQLIPQGSSRLLERRDLMMLWIQHPDPIEVQVAEGHTGWDEKWYPIPYVTSEELYRSPGNGVPLLEEKLRNWIDERKKQYWVEVMPISIEDDPDSSPESEI